MKRFYTLLVILTLFSSWIHNATASDEADWMPDANLRTAVRSALNLNNNDALTQAGMANLTGLTARNAQISSLTGLEHATNLQKLDLRDNTISNISALSGLTNLESLKLKGNNISSVSALSGLTNLTLLNLKENNISSISDLSGLTNLEHLRVDANSITDVQPLTSLVNLERLWIAGNSLTNAHLLSSLTGLTQIDIPIPDPPDTTAPSVTVSVPSGTQNGTFDATITFTESVSNFVQSDVSLSGSAASITSWRANSGNTVYTATITPTASGTVTIGVAANVATDAANNQNTAATSKSVTVSVDTTAPGVTVSVPSGVQNGAFNATITFTETVSGFTQSNVSLSGSAASITGWSANSGNTVYTATITPTASGTVTIGVAANVATDAANNSNTAATSQTVSVDVDKPSVIIGVPSGTQTGAFNATITFSETVSGFTQSDVSLSGSAASITSWRANSSNTVYTATITPTASGTVTIGVAANVATDAANNQNTAATSKSVTVSVDTTAPGVTVSVPSGVQNGAFNATITFTEPVSGFVRSEVSLSGSAASITSWRANSGNTAYTATITPTTSGTVTIGVAANVATDAANNSNTAATSKTVTVDVDRPTVTIGVPAGTQTGAFDATITFSETVSNFVGSEVSLSGSAASITGWSANSDNTVYTATITPTASGTVTIGVAANVATDAANNANTAATSKTVTVNIPDPIPDPATWMPDVNLRAAVRSALSLGSNDTLTQAGMANLTGLTARNAQIGNLTGLEHATNLQKLDFRDNTISSISALSGLTNLESLKLKGNNISSVSALSGLTNLTLLNLKENNISSISTLSGLTNLEHLRVDENSITDVQPLTSLVNLSKLWIAGNSLTNAHLLSSLTGLTYIDIPIPDPPDTTAPSVTVSVPSGTQNGAFNVTITFTESVSNFVQSDVSLRGSAASITSWRANSGNTVYTATITPTARGTVTIGVDANVATDAANNQNTAATSKTVSVDVDKPTVTIGVPSGVQNGAFDATITFTESVSNFVQSDVSLRGSAASITSWRANSSNTVYTATITPTASGTVTIGVAANVATDTANNQNTAATSKTVTVDVDRPTVTIGVPSGVQNGAFDATITFSETVSGFVGSDVSLRGSAASITSWRANNGNTVYTATITPTASGTVTIGVAANVATDAVNNQNTAATSKSVTVSVDTTAPGVTVSVPSGVQNGAFNATITFTESVSNFVQSDVSLSGSAASITSWRANSGNTIYTATITPTASGTVTIGVAANVATDAANNSNTAATSQTVSVDVDKPSVTIGVPSGTQNGAFNATITFTEAVSNFVQSDVSLSGSAASITGWRANSSSTVYTATITPTASGTVTIGVAANVATDAANNQNTAATSKSVTVSVDTTAPGVTVSVPSGVQNGAFNATITFTESVSGFTQSEVSLRGSAASITSWRANSDDTVYTVTITPTTSGTVTIDVAAGVATDAANNQNTAATSKSVTVSVDTTVPGVTVSVPSGIQNGQFSVSITFTESISNLWRLPLELGTNTAGATINSEHVMRTNGGTTSVIQYVTPTRSGEVMLRVPAGIATDAEGNANTASEVQTVSVDVDAPGVSITVPSDVQNGAFSVTIMFTESVSNFVQSDVSLRGSAASITSWRANSSNTVYTATITPTASGTVTIGVAANVATDAANNQNTAATSKTVSIDVDKPTVTIGVPSGTQINAFNATITFSETVSGFTQSDVSLSSSAASITSWRANSSNTVYTATITPTANGTVTIGVAANVATDAANNANTAATSKTVAIRTVTILVVQSQPGVSILVPSGVQNGAFDATITFSETVSGFVGSEVSLSGSAASITSWRANSDNTVYTATITPTASGTVTIGVAANVATDAANNQNTAATTQAVTVDLDPPSATLVLLPEVDTDRIDVQITFTEPVEGFESTDLSITTNGLTQLDLQTIDPPPIVSITGWRPSPDKTTYTIYIETYTSTEGQVIINVPASVATDIAGNPNIAGSELSVDKERTILYVTLSYGGPEGFSQGYSSGCGWQPERIRDFLDINEDGSIDEDDVALVEAALGQFGDGIANSRTDINCDNTVDNKDLAFVDDTEGPTATIIVPTDTQPGAFGIRVRFNEVVFDFDKTDISLADSTATATVTPDGYSYGWGNSTGPITYHFTITPTTSGDLVISVPAGVATDALDNQNTASVKHTVTVNMGIPSVSSMFSTSVEPGVFKIIITFSEAVSGFEQEDLWISSARASITAWEATDNTTFTATVTATTSGIVSYAVPAGVATDADGNLNTSKSGSRKVDLDPPSVEVSVPTDEQSGAFDVTIAFSEQVLNFEQTDVSLAGSTAHPTITDWTIIYPFSASYRTTYEATITPMTNGTVVITIPADVATDRSGNSNTASDTHSITVSYPDSSRAPASLSGIVLDPTALKTLDPEVLEAQLDILRAGSDGSLKYLQAIAVLESVLAEMRPEKTVLLANYPNPFNPETWIPYHLANDTDVQLSIYDINGALVRQLDLGYQRTGYYTNRSRAAYWDGRNEFGEQVATGIYFYQLQAGSESFLRKMVILK